jgi:hypothetical protein
VTCKTENKSKANKKIKKKKKHSQLATAGVLCGLWVMGRVKVAISRHQLIYNEKKSDE